MKGDEFLSISIKQLFKGSIVITISNLFLKALNFFLLPLYTRVLSPEAYGVADMILNLSSVLYCLMSLSIDWGVLAFFYDEKNETHYKKIYSSSYFVLFLAALFNLLLLFFTPFLSMLLFQTKAYSFAVAIGVISTTICLLFLAPSLNVRLRSHLTQLAIINVLSLSLTLGLNIFFILILKLDFYSIILSTLISNIFQLILFFVFNRKYFSLKSIDFSIAKKLTVYSIPLMPNQLINWITTFSDRYIVNYYFSTAEVGLYSSASRVTGLISLATAPFMTAFSGFAFSNADEKDASKTFAFLLNLVLVPLIIIAAGLSLFAREIVAIMMSPDFKGAYHAVGFLAFGQVAYVAIYMVGIGMNLKKRAKWNLYPATISAIVNIVLNFILVPKFGYVAAAFTTLLSHLTTCIISYFLSQLVYPCEYQVVRLLLTFVSICTITFLGRDLTFILKAFIFIFIIFFIMYVFRLTVKKVYLSIEKYL